jgi:hypothetical protein
MDNTKLQLQEALQKIAKLESDMTNLSQNFYKNNFSAHQDFNKASSFNTSLKVPSYSSLPTCEVGQIAESGGVLYICSATDTWTVVGTQV